MGWCHEEVCAVHKTLGWGTAAWALIHAGGELTFIVSQNSLGDSFNVAQSGENLLFLFGALSLVLIIVHCFVAYMRRHPAIQPSFRTIHRALAATLLLSATAHWWPFALFLVPTAAVHATGAALRSCKAGTDHLGVDCSDVGSRRTVACALGMATAGAVIGTGMVWMAREQFMRKPDADLYCPFLFPPAALTAGYLLGYLAAAGSLQCSKHALGSQSSSGLKGASTAL